MTDSDHADVTQLAPVRLSLYLNQVIDGALTVRLGRLAEPIRRHNALSKRNSSGQLNIQNLYDYYIFDSTGSGLAHPPIHLSMH